MTFAHLLEKGPGQTVEFLADLDADALAEVLIAFANGDGGTVLVGVSADGEVNGNLLAEDVEGVLRRALGRCRPPVRTEWRQVETPHGTVITLEVPRSTELHTLADGRVLIRSGARNRPLGGEEVRHLAATKSSGDFEMEIVAGATRADLDDELIAEYVAKREEKQRRPVARPIEELLVEIGAMTGAGEATVAGILLFGRNPQGFIPQSGLVFVRFEGTEARGPGGLPGYSRREEIPLADFEMDLLKEGISFRGCVCDDSHSIYLPILVRLENVQVNGKSAGEMPLIMYDSSMRGELRCGDRIEGRGKLVKVRTPGEEYTALLVTIGTAINKLAPFGR